MMFSECLQCGAELQPPTAIGLSELRCMNCGHLQRFIRGPLVMITGSPGVGKSALAAQLTHKLDRAVVLDFDLTGRHEYDSDSRLMLQWFREWLRVGIAVAQGSKFLVLSGFVRPQEFEEQPERPWLSEIVYLALVCDPEELARGLQDRWKSRAISQEELSGLVGINEEVRRIGEADPHVTVLDTTGRSQEEITESAFNLIRKRVGG